MLKIDHQFTDTEFRPTWKICSKCEDKIGLEIKAEAMAVIVGTDYLKTQKWKNPKLIYISVSYCFLENEIINQLKMSKLINTFSRIISLNIN